MKKLLLSILIALPFLSANAYATVYNYDYAGPNNASNAGTLTNFHASFDDNNTAATNDGFLSFSTDIDYSANPANKPNVFWFALNAGGSPSSSTDDIAQMMIDLTTGDMFVYSYKGNVGPNVADHIATYNNFVNVNDNGSVLNINFSNLDASLINSYAAAPGWTGVNFDDNIGVWALGYDMDSFTTDGTYVTNYNTSGANLTMVEINSDDTTTEVSEPFGLALLGLIGLGLFMRRRK